MISKIIDFNDKEKWLYPILLFFIWLANYFFYLIIWEHKLGWDEISYLSTARGIAENFDFSGRTTSIMGLIKYPFPQNNHHYPVYSAYLAIFFKFLGVSLKTAYLSTWLSALAASFFIYLTLLLVTEKQRFFSFCLAGSFLFFPRIPDYCDSAMMEIPGCALVSILIYFIFCEIKKGKLNPIFLGAAFIWLYFFKSLFIGILFGFLALIILFYSKKSLLINIFLYVLTIGLLYFIFTKFIFLPLTPMMNFHPRLEGIEGQYADFAGGFFSNIWGNLAINLDVFFQNVIRRYYPLNAMYYPNNDAFYILLPAWFELGAYFLSYFYIIVFSLLLWNKLSSVQRLFIIFTVISIFFFNIIFICLAGGSYGLVSRYNLIYVPLILVSFGIILWECRNYYTQFVQEHKKGSVFILVSLILLAYFPIYYSANLITQWDKNVYHDIGNKNSEIVKHFIGDSVPMFVYFTTGTHTTWDSYPTRIVQFEASAAQISKINAKLPQPIKFLFLNPNNYLFRENQDSIINGKPIVNNTYSFYGFDQANKIVVYRYNPQTEQKSDG